MQHKKITVKEVFKSTSTDEINKYLKEKIVKLMISQHKLDTRAV